MVGLVAMVEAMGVGVKVVGTVAVAMGLGTSS